MNVRLYILQRATALVMAPLVLAHLVIIFYATNRGLSAAEILGRTRGSVAWLSFYGLFVIAIAIHAPLGLRTILAEWTPWRGRSVDAALAAFALALLGAGWRAIGGLFA